MFYCETCRLNNQWPEAIAKSSGRCECCGAEGQCHDRPSSSLPPAQPQPTAAPAHEHSQDCFSEGAQVCGVTPYTGPLNVPPTDDGETWPFDWADLKIDTYRAPDQGGFSRTVDRGVRLTHIPSGLIMDCHEDRSHHRNKAEAMKALAKLVRNWQAAGAPAPRPKAEDVAAALDVITRALAPTPATGLGITSDDAVATLAEVRKAIIEYYDAMVARKHGGVAMDQAMKKIEEIFGLHYDTYRDSKGK